MFERNCLFVLSLLCFCFFFSSRRRHTIFKCDWSSDVCSSDLVDCRPLAVVRSRKGVPSRGKCIPAGRGISGESAGGNVPVAREKQQVAQEDENERCEHHQDERFEYPAHTSDPAQADETERCKRHAEPTECPARPSDPDKQPPRQRPARLR